ncbi:TetR/AcrR family transcriptional regulator [Paenibacillus sp. R14(2021)]|uniref:TetR/AcrR family transcriptional regulator n=1 Tax=Paenibacillus sp. R14(2021) TaxID=2859228 RepID=UPI001C611379|nr:TetR/AcrR family transcriptional regulator [Paenibacillus sp. R14(2021)]
MSRPREFDFDKVLHQLMLTFWTKGYKGTSLEDLIAASKLKKQSLYGAYGDKHTLFLKTLQLYRIQTLEQMRELLNREDSAAKALELWKSSLLTPSDCYPKGCFIVNVALEFGTDDLEVKTEIEAMFKESENLLEEVIVRGQIQNEISKNFPASIIAKSLANTQHGLRILVKAGEENQKIKDLLDYAINSILIVSPN